MNAVLTAGSQAALSFLEKVGKVAKENLFNFDDMTKMMNSAFSVIKKVGLGAVASLTALAFTSPTVAAEFAKMKRPLFEISEELGTSLGPGLKVFNTLLQNLSGWLKENTWFTEGLGAAFETVANIVSGLMADLGELSNLFVKPVVELAMNLKLGDKLEGLIDIFGLTILGAVIGMKLGGPWGALIGAGLGGIATAGIMGNEAGQNLMDDGFGYTQQGGTSMNNPNIPSGGYDIPPINIFINGEVLTADSVEIN